MKISPIVLVRACCIALLLIAGCTSSPEPTAVPTTVPDQVKVKLNWRDGVQFLGFYVARANGYYSAENLEVTLDPIVEASETATLVGLVADGDYDFSMGAGIVLNGQAQGMKVTVFSSILQFSPYAFFARADSGIETLSDFAGHRIAYTSETGLANLEQLLGTAGLTLDDVEVVSAGFDMTPFYEGEVDVWPGFVNDEVVHARLSGLEIVTFPMYEYGLEGASLTLFARPETIADNPDLAVRFLRASLRGWDWAIENPTEAVDIMLEQFPDLASDREFHLASFDAYIPLVRPPGVTVGAIDCDRWLGDGRLAEVESREGLCTTEIFDALEAGGD